MILVDTSVWIDHLHRTEPRLVDHLANDEVGCHPLVIEELALGSIKQRNVFLELLGNLRQFPQLSHAEVMTFIDENRLWGRGLSAVDANLLGSVLLAGGSQLWTRDKRLATVCREVGVALLAES